MYITEIDTVIEDGDVFFPEFDASLFDLETGETGGDEIKYTRTDKRDRKFLERFFFHFTGQLYYFYGTEY